MFEQIKSKVVSLFLMLRTLLLTSYCVGLFLQCRIKWLGTVVRESYFSLFFKLILIT